MPFNWQIWVSVNWVSYMRYLFTLKTLVVQTSKELLTVSECVLDINSLIWLNKLKCDFHLHG